MSEPVATLPRRRNIESSLRQLEDEVGEVVTRNTQPRQPVIDMPDVSNPDLGKLSAQAVMTQYEHTAEQVEALGKMVKDLTPQLESSLRELDHDLKTIAEAAKQIRNKGEHTKLLIETASNLSKAIRDACEDFTKKMG